MTSKYLFLLTLLSSSTGSLLAENRLGKCCPPGQIFFGRSKVNCVQAPRNAMEIYNADYDGIVRENGFPRCNEPEDVATTPLADLDNDDFLQIPACLEILHEHSSDESTPIIVHCRSNKDRDVKNDSPSASLPNLLDVRRCCPRNQFFDRRLRSCVSIIESVDDANYSEINEFVSLLPKESGTEFFRINRGLPKCNGAIFDYEVGLEDIVMANGTMRVILPSLENDAKERITVTSEDTCFELTPESVPKRKLLMRTCRRSELCHKNSCIRKCCSEGELYFFETGCRKITEPEAQDKFHREVLNVTNVVDLNIRDYGLLYGILCRFDMYPLLPDDNWSLTPEGYLHVPDYDTYQHHQYCMEVLYNNTDFEETVYPMVCFPDPAVGQAATIARYRVTTILEATSSIFLFLTLLVYFFLPSLQNLHGKTLMCHAGSLSLAYGCLAIVPWVTPDTTYWESMEEPDATKFCSAIGYSMFFAFLSAFFWLNVMCYDIWRTFGGLRGTSTRGRAHRKRFFLYCLYAWGLSMLMTITGILSDQTEILPDYLRPSIGLTSCWFSQLPGRYGELVFFIAPVTIQLASNVVFFVLTSVHCSKVKAEIRRVAADPSDPRSKRFHADKTKLIMNMKLFVVMGISWVMEIVSFFVCKFSSNLKWKEEIFYATDGLNCLQGLLIFILFVLKRRVYQALRRRLGYDEKKKVGSQGTTALQDPYRVKKSASSSTLTSTFAVSLAP